MKEEYIELDISVIRFDYEDIVTGSDECAFPHGPNEGDLG